jgi:hypothetical protein
MRYGNLIGYAIIVIVMALALYAYTSGQDTKLRGGLIRSCERVNVLRAQSNISDLAMWRNFSAAVQRERRLSKPGMPDADTHRRSANEISRNAQDITVTALTNCGLAIDNPARYETQLAGPIGDLSTGREFPEVRSIEEDSRDLIARRQRN